VIPANAQLRVPQVEPVARLLDLHAWEIQQSQTSNVGPGLQFAVIVYNDRVKQHSALRWIRWKYWLLALADIANSTRRMTQYAKTLLTKPEVHYVFIPLSSEEDRATAICERIERQTNRRTNTLIAILRTPWIYTEPTVVMTARCNGWYQWHWLRDDSMKLVEPSLDSPTTDIVDWLRYDTKNDIFVRSKADL